MQSAHYTYHHEDQELQGFLAHDGSKSPKPAVLIAHDWSGRNDFACQKAQQIAEMGYLGFAIDMYGQAQVGRTVEEKMALMQPLANDRVLLRARMLAAYDAVSKLEEVDKNKIAAIGFCFGGMCVLDLARTGASVKGVVSFHGLLDKPHHLPNYSIMAKVLVLQGYDDPMVKPEQVDVFCKEMTDAKVDWQVHQYGNTMHGFTNPLAQDPVLGTVYNPVAKERAWQSMVNFLEEIFG